MGDSKQLVAISVEEVSGVDRPANQLPGWVLTKMENLLSKDSKDKTVADTDTNTELSPEERGLLQKFIDFMKKSNASKEDEVTQEEHDAAIEAVKADQAAAITKAVADALAARDAELAKTAADEKAAADKAAADAAAAEAAKGTETEVEYAKAEDVAVIAKSVEDLTQVIDNIADALTAVLEKSARRTSLDDAPAADKKDGKDLKKSAGSGIFEAAIKSPGKVITMTDGQ